MIYVPWVIYLVIAYDELFVLIARKEASNKPPFEAHAPEKIISYLTVFRILIEKREIRATL